MRVNGDLVVFIGALLVWLTGITQGCSAVVALAEGRWLVALFWSVAAYGSGVVGLRVWRAA